MSHSPTTYLLSIITIVKNAEKTIERCISSVTQQKDNQCEYIIVDGLSDDRTIEIINRHGFNIDILISEHDNGISEALNKGISLSTGTYILYVHADDYLHDNAIQNIKRILTTNTQRELIHCFGVHLYDKNDHFITASYSRTKLISRESSIHHAGIVFPRRLINKLGGFDLNYKLAMDYDLFLRAYIQGYLFCQHKSVLANRTLAGISYIERNKALKEVKEIRSKYFTRVDVIYWYFYALIKDEFGRLLKRSSWGTRLYRLIWKFWNKKRGS